MTSAWSVDPFTLFAANAIILLVTALAFAAAWRGQRQERCWGSWIAANTTLALALIFYMLAPAGEDGLPMVLANCLLVVGFALRWRAARQFGRRSTPLVVLLVPTLAAVALFALPRLFDHAAAYAGINVILALQAMTVAHEFWRDRGDGLPSRYGLVAAYMLIGISFAVRAAQGMLLTGDLNTYLPQDVMLQIHLVIALFHTTASGAFALSIAYERGAIDLREAALRDPLTGLYNRRAFESRLQEYLAGTQDEEFAVVIFDIDRFKAVNDRHGHSAGDAALRACAATCLQNVRGSDFVARIGGEEFAAILPGISAVNAFELTDRVRGAVGGNEVVCNEARFQVTMSAGVIHSSSGVGTMDDLMNKADMGLYRAKNRGRNRTEQFAA
jgi:diguanylate cyclase (GGDEF)-like protein